MAQQVDLDTLKAARLCPHRSELSFSSFSSCHGLHRRRRLTRRRCCAVLDRVGHGGNRGVMTRPTRLRETELVGRTEISQTHTHTFLCICFFGAEAGPGVTDSRLLSSEGVFCAHFWDGFLCWEETPAGKSVTKTCSDQPDLDLDSAGETHHIAGKTNG